MRIIQTAAIAALAGTILVSAPASTEGRYWEGCQATVDAEIARLQIDPGRIGTISYKAQQHTNSAGNEKTSRILAWIDLTDCTGKLVMDLSPRCVFKQAYTTDECTVEGLSN